MTRSRSCFNSVCTGFRSVVLNMRTFLGQIDLLAFPLVQYSRIYNVAKAGGNVIDCLLRIDKPLTEMERFIENIGITEAGS